MFSDFWIYLKPVNALKANTSILQIPILDSIANRALRVASLPSM